MSRSGWQRDLSRKSKADAALQNEIVTRERVERLERGMRDLQHTTEALRRWRLDRDFREQTFWGRVGFLLSVDALRSLAGPTRLTSDPGAGASAATSQVPFRNGPLR